LDTLLIFEIITDLSDAAVGKSHPCPPLSAHSISKKSPREKEKGWKGGNLILPYAALRAARISASEKPLSLILEPMTGKELLGNPRFSHSFLHGKTIVFPTPFKFNPEQAQTSFEPMTGIEPVTSFFACTSVYIV